MKEAKYCCLNLLVIFLGISVCRLFLSNDLLTNNFFSDVDFPEWLQYLLTCACFVDHFQAADGSFAGDERHGEHGAGLELQILVYVGVKAVVGLHVVDDQGTAVTHNPACNAAIQRHSDGTGNGAACGCGKV